MRIILTEVVGVVRLMMACRLVKLMMVKKDKEETKKVGIEVDVQISAGCNDFFEGKKSDWSQIL